MSPRVGLIKLPQIPNGYSENKMLRKVGSLSCFQNITCIVVNGKNHSSSQKTKDFCFVFHVGLNLSEIQSGKRVHVSGSFKINCDRPVLNSFF